jgi:hypothetical protein
MSKPFTYSVYSFRNGMRYISPSAIVELSLLGAVSFPSGEEERNNTDREKEE